MLGRIIKKIATYVGQKNKRQFQESVGQLIECVPFNPVDVDVVSFSGSNYLADQLYSVFSFLYNVGIPVSWQVYNDGTYTDSEKTLLESIPGVVVVDIDMNGIPGHMLKACERFTTIKKMVIFDKVVPERTTLLADSDIIFYKNFKHQLPNLQKGNWYIVDESSNYFDKEFLSKNSNIKDPLNLGFLVLNKKPDWNSVFNYLGKKLEDNSIHYWSDQTATHIMATAQKFSPLPPDLFVNSGHDSFSLLHEADYNKIALRHFVGPIRHKMWQYSWKKVIAENPS